eukprot:TRINITY_DN1404_c0_g1_i1.p1 TRINITY_DN1404_c0_g1~~TRINITY_DN1404_c0_g1_i1.p1  ORF type:complete len:270 (+),score=47.65 TRINITY_DN1404_c0_g1_i1:130-939(+)
MIRRPPRSTQGVSSAASDVYKRQEIEESRLEYVIENDELKIWKDTEVNKQGSNGILPKIIRTHTSKQFSNVRENWTLGVSSKLIKWNNTHFIFVLDASMAAEGRRWKGTMEGYELFLQYLEDSANVVVSTFCYDDSVSPHIKELPPREAKEMIPQIPFSKGTTRNFDCALDKVINLVNKECSVEYKGYLPVVCFIAAAKGRYPYEQMRILSEMRKEGTKFLFYSFAVENEEDDDLRRISQELEGEHFQVTDSDAMMAVFVKAMAIIPSS